MVNWKNLIKNPPEPGQYGYYLFKIQAKHPHNNEEKSATEYIHGCLKPPEDGKPYTTILYQKEQEFSLDLPNIIKSHKIDPDKWIYLYLNLQEIL